MSLKIFVRYSVLGQESLRLKIYRDSFLVVSCKIPCCPIMVSANPFTLDLGLMGSYMIPWDLDGLKNVQDNEGKDFSGSLDILS